MTSGRWSAGTLRAGIRAVLRWGPLALAILAGVYPLAGLLARYDWRADLIRHFPEPALALTLGALAACLRRRRRVALGLAVLAILQAVPLLRYEGANPVPPDPGSPARLKLVVANVQVGNPFQAPLVDLIRRERPDVVGLIEVSDEWLHRLADLRREFPYRHEAPAGPQGLALWFREPPLALDPARSPTPDGWPALGATVRFAGRDLRIWLVHPSSPLRRRGSHVGHPELDALAAQVAEAGGSRLVVGDLNTTEGSPHFGDFLQTTGLRDSRLGFGRQPSWPDWSPLYRIAIDHALVSRDLAIVDRRLGPANGSDHFPLVLELAPASGVPRAESKVPIKAD